MIYYENTDFLQYFDEEKIIDQESGLFEYNITSDENVFLNIYLNLYEGTVCCTLLSPKGTPLVDFAMHNIVSIKCDKEKPNVIQFLFFKQGCDQPSIIATIKPTIELSLDLD